MTNETANAARAANDSPVENYNGTSAPLVAQMADADITADWPVIDDVRQASAATPMARP